MTKQKSALELLQQLADAISSDISSRSIYQSGLMAEVQALLSEPEPERETGPFRLSERSPGPEHCDDKGRVWWGRPEDEWMNADWTLATESDIREFCEHCPPFEWMPHWAIRSAAVSLLKNP